MDGWGMTMSDTEKNLSLIDRWREKSGLYKLGFDPSSAMGLIFPFAAVIVIGGLVGAFIVFAL